VSFPRLAFHHDVARTLIGGAFYGGSAYPPQYQGAYFFGDYEYGFVSTLRLDESGQLVDGPHEFVSDGADGLVALRMGPDGLLYLLSVDAGMLVRVRYDGTSDPGAPHQAAETVVSSLYAGEALEGPPAATLVEPVGGRKLQLDDGTSADGYGFEGKWNATQPAAWAGGDAFAARWLAVTRLSAGDYQLEARADDGLRLWLDDELLVDAWAEQPPTTYRLLRTLAEGLHTIRVEHFNHGSDGELSVKWAPLPTPVAEPGGG
jgi:hypothetical protein